MHRTLAKKQIQKYSWGIDIVYGNNKVNSLFFAHICFEFQFQYLQEILFERNYRIV